MLNSVASSVGKLSHKYNLVCQVSERMDVMQDCERRNLLYINK